MEQDAEMEDIEEQEQCEEHVEEPERAVRPRRRRARGAVLPAHILAASLQKAARTPDYFCCVCCKILFFEEALTLRVPVTVNIDAMEWPCYQYGRDPSRKNGRLVACASHRDWKNDFLALVTGSVGEFLVHARLSFRMDRRLTLFLFLVWCR